jgi:anti-sigma factor ChrR (cupin superfamily)
VPSWHCVCLEVDSSAANRGGHVQLLLGAYLLGGLTASQEVAVRAHLERCERCRAEHDELAVVPSWLDLLTPEGLASDPETLDGP